MEARRLQLIAALVFVVMGIGYYYVAREVDSENKTEPAAEESPAHRLEKFRLVENPRENAVWILDSPEARQMGKKIDLTSPEIVYKEYGDTIAEITAQRGSYSLPEMLLELRGNVLIKRLPENQVFETELLHWDREQGILETDARVKMKVEHGDIEARGLFIDLADERMELKSEVKWHWR